MHIKTKHTLSVTPYILLISIYTSLFSMSVLDNADLCTYIFNFLSITHQISLATTNKFLKNIFDSNAYTHNCTINLEEAKETIFKKIENDIKVLFVQNLHPIRPTVTRIYEKIRTNRIGGFVKFKCTIKNERDNSDLNKIFEQFTFNQSITALDFRNCNLTNQNITALTTALSKSKSTIKILSLCNKGLSHNDMCPLLKQIPHLEELDCSYNNIVITKRPLYDFFAYEIDVATQEVIKEKTLFFPHDKEDDVVVLDSNALMILGEPLFILKKLDLSNCLLTGIHIDWIIKILQKNKNLEILTLQHNMLNTDQQKHLALRKQADMPKNVLTLLDLSNQKHTPHAQEILPYKSTRPTLKILM